MKHEIVGRSPPGAQLCRYGPSRLPFRGPAKPLDAPYVAFVGGTPTFGKYVTRPFPEQIEQVTGVTALNLGCVNAGVDAFYKDRTVVEMCRRAEAVVLQVIGAHNLSNRFYKVHPRRNDRFLRASDQLMALYPEVDFADYSFTRHLLSDLAALDPARFAVVREELQAAWLGRMQSLVADFERPVILFWFADHAPDAVLPAALAMQAEPLFVTREMVETLRPHVAQVVELSVPHADTDGMVFDPSEAQVARRLPGVRAHDQAAAALLGSIEQLLHKEKEPAQNGRAPRHGS